MYKVMSTYSGTYIYNLVWKELAALLLQLKPIKWKRFTLNNRSLEMGLIYLAYPIIRLPNTVPIPAPDPATPTVAAPAPMNLAAVSMSRLTALVWKLRTATSCWEVTPHGGTKREAVWRNMGKKKYLFHFPPLKKKNPCNHNITLSISRKHCANYF